MLPRRGPGSLSQLRHARRKRLIVEAGGRPERHFEHTVDRLSTRVGQTSKQAFVGVKLFYRVLEALGPLGGHS